MEDTLFPHDIVCHTHKNHGQSSNVLMRLGLERKATLYTSETEVTNISTSPLEFSWVSSYNSLMATNLESVSDSMQKLNHKERWHFRLYDRHKEELIPVDTNEVVVRC